MSYVIAIEAEIFQSASRLTIHGNGIYREASAIGWVTSNSPITVTTVKPADPDRYAAVSRVGYDRPKEIS